MNLCNRCTLTCKDECGLCTSYTCDMIRRNNIRCKHGFLFFNFGFKIYPCDVSTHYNRLFSLQFTFIITYFLYRKNVILGVNIKNVQENAVTYVIFLLVKKRVKNVLSAVIFVLAIVGTFVHPYVGNATLPNLDITQKAKLIYAMQGKMNIY